MISLHKRSDGGFVTTIKTETERSWVLNDKGKCTLPFAVTDAKAVRRYMGSRLLIYIDHPTLPAWGGVIETDENWREDGVIEFTAWSGESLLISRKPIVGLVTAGSPGGLFAKLINLANKDEDLRIRVGNINQAGGSAEATLDGTNLFDVIQSLAQRHKMEFSIDPILDADGKLYFSANWYVRQGVNSPLVLKEGLNIERRGNVYRRQRRVANKVTGLGSASTNATRPAYSVIDAESRDLYGLMEEVVDFNDVTLQATLIENTKEKLGALRFPRDTYQITALDVDDTFGSIRKGNVHPLKAQTFGWLSDSSVGTDEAVRLLGMRYFDNPNVCELTVDKDSE